MTKFAACVLTLCLSALPLAGYAATPALSTERAEAFDEIAHFGRMTEMCGVIGYTVDPQGFDALLTASIALAEKEGVPHDKAVAMFETAAAARKAKDAPVTEAFSRRMVAAYTANDPKAGGVVLNEWFTRADETCRGFTQSARLVAFIDPPTDPENKAGFNAFIDMVLSRLK